MILHEQAVDWRVVTSAQRAPSARFFLIYFSQQNKSSFWILILYVFLFTQLF